MLPDICCLANAFSPIGSAASTVNVAGGCGGRSAFIMGTLTAEIAF